MSYETLNVSAEILNTAFTDKVFSGQIKEAQEAGSLYIRQKLYGEGILRRLFEPRTLTAEDLDPELDNDRPSIICEKERLVRHVRAVQGHGRAALFRGSPLPRAFRQGRSGTHAQKQV